MCSSDLLLERQCFRHHFQDIPSKMNLMDTLIRPTMIYGSEVWGPSLLDSDWASVERVQTLLLCRFIRCKQTVPHNIILAEFGAKPFRLEAIFRIVSYLHRIRSLVDTRGENIYPYLAYCSSENITHNRTSRTKCWFIGMTELLGLIGIQPDHLPPFQYH